MGQNHGVGILAMPGLDLLMGTNQIHLCAWEVMMPDEWVLVDVLFDFLRGFGLRWLCNLLSVLDATFHENGERGSANHPVAMG